HAARGRALARRVPAGRPADRDRDGRAGRAAAGGLPHGWGLRTRAWSSVRTRSFNGEGAENCSSRGAAEPRRVAASGFVALRRLRGTSRELSMSLFAPGRPTIAG